VLKRKENSQLSKVKIISRFDDSFELLDGLLIDESHAIFTETTQGLSSIYFVVIKPSNIPHVYEMGSATVTLAEEMRLKDNFKILHDVKEMILGMSFYTYITKIHLHGRDESLDLIETGGHQIKEWKHEE
jgi:hypothetical protein